MADKITKRDAVFLAVLDELYQGKGWHGKGIPTTDFNPHTNEDLKRALFVHDMARAGIMVTRDKLDKLGRKTGHKENVFCPGDDYYAVAKDDGLPVGAAVGKVFRTPDNAVLYKFFCDAIAGSGYDVCSLGTVDDRNEFFVDAVGKVKSVAGREEKPYVGLTRMFGGKGSVLVGAHRTVMQCANTTALFRSSVTGAERLKNTLSIFDRLPEAKIAIQNMSALQIAFDLALEDGATFKLDKDTAREAFAGFVAKSGKFGARGVGRVIRLLQLFKDGKGNAGENAVDWFNAVTDYFTHESVGSENSALEKDALIVKQWYSSEHGTAADVKMELAQLLFPQGAFAADKFNGFVASGKDFISKLDKEDKELLLA